MRANSYPITHQHVMVIAPPKSQATYGLIEYTGRVENAIPMPTDQKNWEETDWQAGNLLDFA